MPLLIGTTSRGIETIYDHAYTGNVSGIKSQKSHAEPPTFAIATSLLFGFIFMLVAEQISSQISPPSLQAMIPLHRSPRNISRDPLRHSNTGHFTPSRPLSPTTATSITDGDVELELDVELNSFNNFNDRDAGWQTSACSGRDEVERRDPRLLTFGLIIHSLADGLALGASLVTSPEAQEKAGGVLGSSLDLSSLPLVVFSALTLHKGP